MTPAPLELGHSPGAGRAKSRGLRLLCGFQRTEGGRGRAKGRCQGMGRGWGQGEQQSGFKEPSLQDQEGRHCGWRGRGL